MIDWFVQWFMEDPLKNFLLIFGSGGVLAYAFKWRSMWANRRRIHIRVLSENFDPKTNPNIEMLLRFEATNVGDKATSLEPSVVVRSVTPKTELRKFMLTVQEADRQLPPHIPKQFTAGALVSAVYPVCWFKRYSFRVLRGSGSTVRYRNARNEDISFGRYWYEYFLFRYFKRIIKAA